MRGRTLSVIAGASLGIVGLGIHSTAQSPSPSTTSPLGALKQLAYLKASNGEAGDHFGCGGVLDGHAGYGAAMSGDGNTIAIGAPHESSAARGINGNQSDNSAHDAGAVYVFTRNGASWTQQAYVKASNAEEGDEFGHAVALSADGNTLAVSAFWESSGATGVNGNQNDNSVPQAGAVYVFTRAGNTWRQQAYIKASNTGEAGTADTFGDGDQFGFSLALSDDGNTLAVGAHAEDSRSPGINSDQKDNTASSAGAVYVYTRTGTTWSHQAYVKPANPDGGDLFGFTVALNADGNTLAVGSYDEGGSARGINGTVDNNRRGSGAAYVFTRTGTTWAQQAYIKTSNAEGGDSFGVHVQLSDDGNTLLAGSLDEDCLATGVNPPGCDTDQKADTSAGAAYVFVRSGQAWSQQAFLKPSTIMRADWFGSRLALSGDGNTAAIPSPLEGSSARGLNGNQKDSSATDSGAVFLFTRTGGAWSQQVYLKASNSEAFDEFGSSLALSRDGRTMVFTSKAEDSAAKSVNGNQNDNSADEAGAAYVFGVGAGAPSSF
jgi:trimeric autotransporter adhesin